MSNQEDNQIENMVNIFTLLQDMTLIQKSIDSFLNQMVQCESDDNFNQIEESSFALIEKCHNRRKQLGNI